MTPVLSIITPVYNNVQFIVQCLENVISQQCKNVEHLIMDGGRTDGTADIISRYAAKYKHISWISEKDCGQSDAMNKGLMIAKGQFISFLNVDDYYSSGTLSNVIHKIEKYPSGKFLVGNCNVWDENDQLIYVNQPKKLKSWHILSGYYFPVNPTAYFYDKEIHQVAGFYNVENHYNMDLEFLIKASFSTEMKYYSEIWGNFRVLPEAKTGSDLGKGLLEKRKRELLLKYRKKATFKIAIFTFGVEWYEYTKRICMHFNRNLKKPFDMVYWKMRKIIEKKNKR